ncbi:TMhelix containing protein [Vibrio phage 1.177.O._10N.286.45.E10]|nr:TMhelix containing protein [Vibrio phage 1.177.O._10N.286.45.E10]
MSLASKMINKIFIDPYVKPVVMLFGTAFVFSIKYEL